MHRSEKISETCKYFEIDYDEIMVHIIYVNYS